MRPGLVLAVVFSRESVEEDEQRSNEAEQQDHEHGDAQDGPEARKTAHLVLVPHLRHVAHENRDGVEGEEVDDQGDVALREGESESLLDRHEMSPCCYLYNTIFYMVCQ